MQVNLSMDPEIGTIYSVAVPVKRVKPQMRPGLTEDAVTQNPTSSSQQVRFCTGACFPYYSFFLGFLFFGTFSTSKMKHRHDYGMASSPYLNLHVLFFRCSGIRLIQIAIHRINSHTALELRSTGGGWHTLGSQKKRRKRAIGFFGVDRLV
jgi:hypothetical protein